MQYFLGHVAPENRSERDAAVGNHDVYIRRTRDCANHWKIIDRHRAKSQGEPVERHTARGRQERRDLSQYTIAVQQAQGFIRKINSALTDFMMYGEIRRLRCCLLYTSDAADE